MKLEDQVCSLEFAKRLKELGVKQNSYFYWSTPWPRGSQWLDEKNSDYRLVEASNPDSCSAFTVAELGEMLPNYKTWKWEFGKGHRNTGWHGDRVDSCGIDYELFSQKTARTEAEARAKMLIYLIEQGLR